MAIWVGLAIVEILVSERFALSYQKFLSSNQNPPLIENNEVTLGG